MDKYIIALFVLGTFVALPGCKTTETNSVTHAASASATSTGSVAVSVSSETTVVTQNAAQPVPASPSVDILAGAKKPCSAVAADAPKFVEPETK